MTRSHSIRSIGLETFLDTHRGLHANLGYTDFVGMLEMGVPKRKMARRFSVTAPTIYKWIAIYEAELNRS